MEQYSDNQMGQQPEAATADNVPAEQPKPKKSGMGKGIIIGCLGTIAGRSGRRLRWMYADGQPAYHYRQGCVCGKRKCGT